MTLILAEFEKDARPVTVCRQQPTKIEQKNWSKQQINNLVWNARNKRTEKDSQPDRDVYRNRQTDRRYEGVETRGSAAGADTVATRRVLLRDWVGAATRTSARPASEELLPVAVRNCRLAGRQRRPEDARATDAPPDNGSLPARVSVRRSTRTR